MTGKSQPNRRQKVQDTSLLFPEQNPSPVLRVGRDGAILYANPASTDLLQVWGSAVGRAAPDVIRRHVVQALDDGKPTQVEARCGSIIYSFCVAPISGQDYANVYARDVTAYRQAQETLQNANELLQAQAEELQAQTEELRTQAEELTAGNEELRQTEQALRESEEHVRRKLESVLSPEGDLGELELADLLDADAFQKLMDDFYTVAHIPMSIIDIKGRILVGVGWQEICTRFHRVQPETCRHCIESDTVLSAGLAQGEHRLYRCKNNMWDMVTPIIVAGRHVGNVFTGQFFFEDETVDRELFRAQARQYGFDETQYLDALDRVPRLSRETVDRGMKFFVKLADTISQLSYSNVKLARLLAERNHLTESLRELNVTLESKVTERTAELQHRAGQLQKLTLELSQAEDRERKRIAGILHEDLQQQIAGAKFHLNLAKSRAAHDPRQQTLIERVDEMLRQAIEKSRDLSHDLSPAVLHMNDLKEIFGWLARQVKTKHGLTVHLDVPDEAVLQSESLAMFLFRAAQEMLFNVVKHARVNEAAIRVRRTRQLVYLSVCDQGRGFDPEELKETTGFGLFSIRERVELLGGRMKIKSAKGKGSRFRIMVPDTQRVAVPSPSEARIARLSEAGPYPNERLRVLLADDHELVRMGLASLLREMPHVEVVGEAANGREAVDLASQLRPDVVIMDVSMPVMNGEEATRQIRRYLPEIRVVALSMYEQADVIDRMYQAGADRYVLKTASSEELLAAIHGKASDAQNNPA